jgi:hypothetical protein
MMGCRPAGGIGMMRTGNRMGEFPLDHIGLFDFRPEDFQATSTYFGLGLSEAYLIAHLRSPDLTRHMHAVRPVYLHSSGGMLSALGRADGIYNDPRGERFLRGGFAHRRVDGNGELVIEGSGGTWSGGVEKTFSARFGEEVHWEDSDELSLTGRLLGPGTQVHVPWRDGEYAGGTAHTGIFHEVAGTLFGEPVVGIVILEHLFNPPGRTLHGSVLRKRYVGAWNGFANVYEDGSAQYGQFGFGAGPFRHGIIVDGKRQVVSHVASIEAEYRDHGLGSRLEYRMQNGETWECVVEKNGTMLDQLATARMQGSSAQLHKGFTAPVGESRRRRAWYSILEWFPERTVNDASDAEIALPGGF